jgi:hypothetical protein
MPRSGSHVCWLMVLALATSCGRLHEPPADPPVDSGAADAGPPDGGPDSGTDAGSNDAGPPAPYQWPLLPAAPAPGCTLAPTFVRQPAFDGGPDQLPTLASLPALAAQRDCYQRTLRAQAYALFEAHRLEQPTHHFVSGGVHFYAHENNVQGFSAEQLVGYVGWLQAAGVELVGIHMGTFPWTCPSEAAPGCAGSAATVAKYDAVMLELARRGMRVRAMLPITDSVSRPFSGWADYRDEMGAMVQAMLLRYGGAGSVAQVMEQIGMHEPSSVETLIVRKSDPNAVLEPDVWRGELVDRVCDLAHDAGAKCTASLIPAPPGTPDGEDRFVPAAVASRADWLGVNNIHLFNLEPSVIAATDDFIRQFEQGVGTAPGRGAGTVFINAAWRGAWPMTAGDPVASNAAGLGCSEHDDLDSAYLSALYAYARARRLSSVTVFYTSSFIAKRACPADVRQYGSVRSPLPVGAPLWTNYQQGNALTDPEYRLRVASALTQTPALTPTGLWFAQLASLSRP